jgi:hypothetical protein
MRRSSITLIAALLAVLALLTHPVAAAAAQANCVMGDQAATGVSAQADMPDMPGMAKASGAKAASVDPCCDHSDPQKPMDGKSCTFACATICAVPTVLPTALAGQILVYTSTVPLPAQIAIPASHDPYGLERPPKSIL